MALSTSETITNEIGFGLLATGMIFLATSILTFLSVPVTLTFLATLFMSKVYWFPQEAPEAPIMSFSRSVVNTSYLLVSLLLSYLSGTFFARQLTLTDAMELYQKKWVTSDKVFTVYLTYNFGYLFLLFVFVNLFRFLENFFTAVAGGVRDKVNGDGQHPAHAE